MSKESIKELRIKYNLTQKMLYEMTGISIRTLQNWEGGKRKCPDYVERLLKFYLENKTK